MSDFDSDSAGGGRNPQVSSFDQAQCVPEMHINSRGMGNSATKIWECVGCGRECSMPYKGRQFVWGKVGLWVLYGQKSAQTLDFWGHFIPTLFDKHPI